MKSKEPMYIYGGTDAIKRTYFILFMFFFVGLTSTYGQESLLRKEIFLKPGLTRFDSVLFRVASQTKIIFTFNASRLNTKKMIAVSSSLRTLSDFLEFLKKEMKLKVKVIENYVVISVPADKVKLNKIDNWQNTATPKVPNNLKSLTAKWPASDNEPMKMILQDTVNTEKAESKGSEYDTLESIQDQDTSNVMQILPATPTTFRHQQIDSLKSNPNLIESKKNDSIAISKSLSNPNSKKDIFLKAGVTVDESTFMGIAAQAGIGALYLTASVNSNLLTTHFRYGLGSSVRINNQLRIHLGINYGRPQRKGSFVDSISNLHNIAVNSDLLRMGAGLDMRWKKWSAQVMISYNVLITTYLIDNAPSDLHIFKKEGDTLFYTIQPAYVMNNTFSDLSNSNTKTWIGLQLNLLYTIHTFRKN